MQARHIESRGKNAHDNFSSIESIQSKEGKGKGKGKHTTIVRKHDEIYTCSHCQNQGNQKDIVIVEDFGSDYEDETKIKIVGVKGKYIVDNDSNIGSSCAYTSKDHVSSKDRKMNALFHIRVITKQIKIDTLIDSGSQANLISEEVVEQLG